MFPVCLAIIALLSWLTSPLGWLSPSSILCNPSSLSTHLQTVLVPLIINLWFPASLLYGAAKLTPLKRLLQPSSSTAQCCAALSVAFMIEMTLRLLGLHNLANLFCWGAMYLLSAIAMLAIVIMLWRNLRGKKYSSSNDYREGYAWQKIWPYVICTPIILALIALFIASPTSYTKVPDLRLPLHRVCTSP